MKIKLDDTHTLISDPMCLWIEEEVKPKDKKPYTRRCSGYAATLEQVVSSYVDKRIKSSEASTLKELAQVVADLKKEVKNWHETLSGKSDN